jgi:hypothetical protein
MMNTMTEPATSPGSDSGRNTRKKACVGVAPRLDAALR